MSIAATTAAYCAAVGLPFIPEALTWEPVNGLSGAGTHAGRRAGELIASRPGQPQQSRMTYIY